MAEKKISHHIRVDPDENGTGILLFRFEKHTTDEAGNVTRQYHRTSLEPGASLDEQMRPVKPHLVLLGFEAPDDATLGNMRKVVASVHTPEVVAKFAAAKAEREKAQGKK